MARATLQKVRATSGARLLSTDSILVEYADDPVGFIQGVLGFQLEFTLPDGTVVDYQARLARDVSKHDRVTVRSGQKTGKTLLAVLLAIWWVCTRSGAQCVLTSSSDQQVKNVLWAELHNVNRVLRKRGINLLPDVPLDPATGIRWEDGRAIRGFATRKRENAAGISGPALFFILDEASGIESAIAEAFLGNATGGAKVLALSNPTESAGFFYETFTTRREFWHQVHLSCYDSPNYITGKRLFPGLAERKPVLEMIAAYGIKSPFVEVRVAGNFPTQVANAVIGLGQVEAARKRWGDVEPTGILELGVDVARFGDDDSVVVGRRGLVAYTPAWIEEKHGFPAWANGYDSKEVAGLVLKVLRALSAPGERVRVKIDAAGGYGGAVADELREQKRDPKSETFTLLEFVTIVEVQVAEASAEPENYPQLRDELWFNGRGWLNDGGTFSPDPRLESELVAPTYSMTRKGQMKVASKDEMKKLLPSGKSPDYADAFLLAIYDGTPGEIDDSSWDDLPPLNRFETDSRGFG
jgi:phage terminase large subunit